MQFDWVVILNQLQSSGVTACFTVIAGVLVFVLGQVVVKFFIEPIHSQSQLLGEIAHSVTFYANVDSGLKDKEFLNEVSLILRKQASQLRASVWTVRWYWLWQFLGAVPKKKNVLTASAELIGWSNSLFRNTSVDRTIKIKKLLNFK
jgi:hypothetical protein